MPVQELRNATSAVTAANAHADANVVLATPIGVQDQNVTLDALGTLLETRSTALATTKTNASSAKTKTDHLTVTAPVNLDQTVEEYNVKSVSTDGVTTSESDAGLTASRAAAIQATIAAQANGGESKPLSDGVYRVTSDVIQLDYQQSLHGKGMNRTILKAVPGATGAIISTKDFTAQETFNYKYVKENWGEGEQQTGITTCATVEKLGVEGSANISEAPQYYNSALTYDLTGIRLYASGHRVKNARVFQVQGRGIHVVEGLGRGNKSGALEWRDDEQSLINDVFVSKCLTGIELGRPGTASGADGHLTDIQVQGCRDYGVRISGASAINAQQVHTWGNGIGFAMEAGPCYLSNIQSDNDICGIRAGAAGSCITQAQLKGCHQIGLEVAGQANITLANIEVWKPGYTAIAAYDPDYVPNDTFNEHPGGGGQPGVYGEAGLPIGARIRQGALGTDVRYLYIDGAKNSEDPDGAGPLPVELLPGVGLEFRSSNCEIHARIRNFKTAVVLNYAYMHGCRLYLQIENCENGVIIYEGREGLSSVASSSYNNYLEIWHHNVDNVVIDNTTGDRWVNGGWGNKIKAYALNGTAIKNYGWKTWNTPNYSQVRSFDPTTVTLANTAHALATLIADMKEQNLLPN